MSPCRRCLLIQPHPPLSPFSSPVLLCSSPEAVGHLPDSTSGLQQYQLDAAAGALGNPGAPPPPPPPPPRSTPRRLPAAGAAAAAAAAVDTGPGQPATSKLSATRSRLAASDSRLVSYSDSDESPPLPPPADAERWPGAPMAPVRRQAPHRLPQPQGPLQPWAAGCPSWTQWCSQPPPLALGPVPPWPGGGRLPSLPNEWRPPPWQRPALPPPWAAGPRSLLQVPYPRPMPRPRQHRPQLQPAAAVATAVVSAAAAAAASVSGQRRMQSWSQGTLGEPDWLEHQEHQQQQQQTEQQTQQQTPSRQCLKQLNRHTSPSPKKRKKRHHHKSSSSRSKSRKRYPSSPQRESLIRDFPYS